MCVWSVNIWLGGLVPIHSVPLHPNTPTMHRALRIKEVFLMILDELGASSTEAAERDNRSLVSLALVCRDWLEPALNGLWKMQGELLPLLRTLPAGKWNEGEFELFVRPSACRECAYHLLNV